VPRLNTIVTISSLPALLAASWFFYGRVFDGPTVCMFKFLFGLPCMGCGLSRAFCCMAHGEFGRMLGYHPLAPVMLGWIASWWVLEIRDIVRKTRTPSPAWFHRLAHTVLFLGLLLWWTRMTVFFASPEGVKSVVTKNIFARLARWDWSNTHEVFVDTDRPAR
jgi:hypothetical protein